MTTKVFVGNLAFPTTDQALAEAFQDCGIVKTGVVITRGRRSLGYGFVEFETPEAAIQAVKSKNNIEFKGRTIKVELASDNPVRSTPALGDRPPRPTATPNLTPSSPPPARGPPSGGDSNAAPRRRRTRRRRPMRNGPGDYQEVKPQGTGVSVAGAKAGDSAGKRPRRIRRRRRTEDNNNRNQNKEDRVLSTTAVFVANLPFTVEDESLKNYFKEFNPQSAHVVVTRNGRSRGYGFVEFATEKDQHSAIELKNGKKFNERDITVTASYKTQEAPATTTENK